MKTADIIALQIKVNTTPDGHWGPKSIAAAQRHLRSLMPQPNPWPGTSQTELNAFYGRAGDESQLVNLPVLGLGIRYDREPVKSIRCHKKVADSLLIVLQELTRIAPQILADYAGCYNNRPMRGGNTPSLHARGAAVDFAPGPNANHTHWPLVATMPFEVMEAFAKQGWLAAGAFWSRDAMHFQATE